MHDGGAAVAKVTGEHQTTMLAALLEFEFDDGRAKDVSGVEQAQAHARHNFAPLVIAECDEAAHGAFSITP